MVSQVDDRQRVDGEKGLQHCGSEIVAKNTEELQHHERERFKSRVGVTMGPRGGYLYITKTTLVFHKNRC